MTALRWAAVGLLLAGPTAVAFFTGGYTDGARVWAGALAWLLALLGILVGTPPRGRAAWVALGGAVGYAAWTLASTAWAPIAGSAWEAGQVAALYAGGLIAAATLLGTPAARRIAEPAVAAGTVVVVGYGLAERLLPGVLEYARSASAEGRLEQPLTYWNGMGMVAALGVVLTARLAGDERRAPGLRALAAASGTVLGLGLGLTVSRGALWACVAGLLTLVVVARRRSELRATLVVAAGGVLATLAAQPFGGVTRLEAGDRVTDGVVVLALVLVLATAAALAAYAAAVRPPRDGVLRLPRLAGWAALALVAGGFALALVLGTDETTGDRPGLSAGAGRLGTLQSNRYEYWKVAGRAFGDAPVAGIGAGGWAVRWSAERPFPESARDAHSLYFQTGAELGLVGLLALALWLGGVALAARGVAPEVAAGPLAGCAVWAAHNALDWDFQLPATTLPVLVLAGLLLAAPRERAT